MDDAPPSPPPLEREPKKRAPRKNPDLSGVGPKAITIKTKAGDNTFSARSKPKREAWAGGPVDEPAIPANPWSAVMNSWLGQQMEYQHISGREADQRRRILKDLQHAKRHQDLQELHEKKEKMRMGAE